MAGSPKLPVVHTGETGRPPYSDAVRKKIIRLLKVGCTRPAAFGQAGIGEATMYRWLKDIDGFREEVQAAEAHAESVYTTRLATRAEAGDTAAIKFWLERRRHGHWRERTSIVDEDPTLEDVIANEATDDDIRAGLADVIAELDRRRASSASDGDDGGEPPEDGGEAAAGVAG